MQNSLQERVEQAAETALKRNGSVGPLELFQEMRLLQPVHVEGWRKGNEYYRVLQPWIQVGPEKFQKAIRHFQEWVETARLAPIEAAYTRRGPRGIEQLQVTEDGDPEWEKFYRTHYAPADLPEKKAERLAAKLHGRPSWWCSRRSATTELQRVRRGPAQRSLPVDGERRAPLSHVRGPGPIGVSARG